MVIKLINTFFIFALIASCSNEKIMTDSEKMPSELIGKWKAVSLFLSDASTGVCHADTPSKDITIELSNELADDKKSYNVTGSSTVNSYFASITIKSIVDSEKKVNLIINTIGSTKMAGSPEMMNCEQNYFQLLSESTGIQFFADKPNRIHIGRLKEADSSPRDGGTYYVFEKL